jgi:integrase
MARTIRDTALQTREARGRLKPRGKPYYRAIEEGLHLGYRKPHGRRGSPAVAGKWVVRRYIGGQAYELDTIAAADDFSDADGANVLNFAQAQVAARAKIKAGPFTVREAVETYVAFLEMNRKTARDTLWRAAAFIYPKLGNEKVEALSTDQLRHWHADLAKAAPRLRTTKGKPQQHREMADDDEGRRRRRSSANRVLTILKAALNRAWHDGKVPSDAAWRRVEPFEDVDAARVRYLTVAEAQRLINAADPEFRPLVEVALQTGARYGEITRLQVHDFNRDSGTLAIRQSKSGKARHIILTEEGVALFKQLTAGRGGHEILLQRQDGTLFGKSYQCRPMVETCEHAKITPRISFHTLRHTWASLAVMNEMPLMVVARNLGHADTRMVEKHYGHLAPSYVAEAVRKGAPRFGFTPDDKVASI